jgi:hypothetical protein
VNQHKMLDGDEEVDLSAASISVADNKEPSIDLICGFGDDKEFNQLTRKRNDNYKNVKK